MPNAERTVIDHVIYGVRDLDGALDRFSAEFGLEPIARASHHAWGTHNAVIPVGFGQFIELLAIAKSEQWHDARQRAGNAARSR